MSDEELPLQDTLNLETATIPWRELQRFFAAGRAIGVAPELDLVKVGVELSRDNADQFRTWMDEGKVAAVCDEQAQAWFEADAEVWALVIKPYVLVQPRGQQ